jgi:hypothetical protein
MGDSSNETSSYSIASILVISCTPARTEILRRQFAELKVPYPITILQAWTPETSSDWLPSNVAPWLQKLLCCTRSHIKALEMANAEEAAPFTIIMKDDVALHRTDFLPVLDSLLSQWDALVVPQSLMCCAGWIGTHPWAAYAVRPSAPITSTHTVFSSVGVGLQAYIVRRGTLSEQLRLLVKPTWNEMTNAVTERYIIPFGQVREPDLMLTKVFPQTYVFPPIAIEQNNVPTTMPRSQEPAEHYYHRFFQGHESKRYGYWSHEQKPDTVVFAILAKNKAAVLPLYLKCLLAQTLPKSQIHLYIRTNDNTDDTETILRAFVEEHGAEYASVFFDASSVSDALKTYKPHECNSMRFQILGKLRQDSVDYAKAKGSHYFVVDCDNFIVPATLEKMMEQKALGVVAPMLVTNTAYSNFHYDVDKNGYLKAHPNYNKVLNRQLLGCVDVAVVHCTYFIANHLLYYVSYDDKSARYEYVIFSDVLRKRKIPQYLDNRQYYGFLTFADTEADFAKEIKDHYGAHIDKYFKTA